MLAVISHLLYLDMLGNYFQRVFLKCCGWADQPVFPPSCHSCRWVPFFQASGASHSCCNLSKVTASSLTMTLAASPWSFGAPHLVPVTCMSGLYNWTLTQSSSAMRNNNSLCHALLNRHRDLEGLRTDLSSKGKTGSLGLLEIFCHQVPLSVV